MHFNDVHTIFMSFKYMKVIRCWKKNDLYAEKQKALAAVEKCFLNVSSETTWQNPLKFLFSSEAIFIEP